MLAAYVLACVVLSICVVWCTTDGCVACDACFGSKRSLPDELSLVCIHMSQTTAWVLGLQHFANGAQQFVVSVLCVRGGVGVIQSPANPLQLRAKSMHPPYLAPGFISHHPSVPFHSARGRIFNPFVLCHAPNAQPPPQDPPLTPCLGIGIPAPISLPRYGCSRGR